MPEEVTVVVPNDDISKKSKAAQEKERQEAKAAFDKALKEVENVK